MPEFIVREKRTVIQIHEAKIEADSLEAAQEIVNGGDGYDTEVVREEITNDEFLSLEPVATETTTASVGFMIRDMLEDRGMIHMVEDGDGGWREGQEAFEIASVDISDVHNPKVHLENGQVFTVRIIAGDR